MDRTDIEILQHGEVFRGYFRVDRYTLRHRLFNDGWSAPVTREVFERGHSVAVLLYDAKADRIVVVEQFRAGALAAGIGPWMIECAAGIMEENEPPEQVARREAQEETGLVINRIEKVGRVIYSPGGCSEICQLFVGEVDSATACGVHGLAVEHEDIKTHVIPFEIAIRQMDEGAIDTAALLITLSWLARHRTALRDRWLQTDKTCKEVSN